MIIRASITLLYGLECTIFAICHKCPRLKEKGYFQIKTYVADRQIQRIEGRKTSYEEKLLHGFKNIGNSETPLFQFTQKHISMSKIKNYVLKAKYIKEKLYIGLDVRGRPLGRPDFLSLEIL
ncbi:hypothetical protein EDEG_01095 [Edhazardia aedis USNM 41457]|uniref:Uncharacterized protein n=1 Tax=Edhazardia aedis (strain USNM 41457) TaxID=1003232 RepID=J9DB38_EDHAE|nr:hypothetical protein EDEG_01095 [Edhazardia aedis USNM 41457]|eukprot:EJW04709.1 hypothetical protein EDEG_01095 [Edhazardia aedis USNM 41457]